MVVVLSRKTVQGKREKVHSVDMQDTLMTEYHTRRRIARTKRRRGPAASGFLRDLTPRKKVAKSEKFFLLFSGGMV
ncbi:MAG: hypothetical protein IKI52_03560 [Clostridia bacterium]|jgi:hypothetical protein|nr:hypothetical protein [Clostridia bacterium]